MATFSNAKTIRILHRLTPAQKYGRRSNLSKSDAIIKLESYRAKSTDDTHIILTGLAGAFGK